MKINKLNEKVKQLVVSALCGVVIFGNIGVSFADGGNSYDDMVVIVNGGHSNQSTGAVGINGMKEEQLAAQVKEIIISNLASKVDAKVSTYNEGLDMQGANKYEDMSNRLKYAYDQLADINMDFHFNASANGGEGFEILVHPNTPEHIKDACRSFAKEYSERTGIPLRRGDGLYITKGFKMASYGNDMVSIIPELGFIDKESDMLGNYDTEENIEKTCGIISDLIVKHFIQNPDLQKDQQGESDDAYNRGEYIETEGEDHSKDDKHQSEKVQITRFTPFKSKSTKALESALGIEEEKITLLDEKQVEKIEKVVTQVQTMSLTKTHPLEDVLNEQDIENEESEIEEDVANEESEIEEVDNDISELIAKLQGNKPKPDKKPSLEDILDTIKPEVEDGVEPPKEDIEEQEIESKPEPKPEPPIEEEKEEIIEETPKEDVEIEEEKEDEVEKKPLFVIKDGEIETNEDVREEMKKEFMEQNAPEIDVNEDFKGSIVQETKPLVENKPQNNLVEKTIEILDTVANKIIEKQDEDIEEKSILWGE